MIVHEIEELVQYLGEKSSSENWGSLWVGGHSAGAHLAASLLHSEVRKYISGLVLISGIYDVRPLITTSVNAALNLT
ncbi:hypothetical protein V9T40_001342 [Parthenolecanium corni]|uniref:Alpha/beta hydrolase fold-3 domain-containing protein n=1 Tax=Parthenolecanium corni TaxID=536013 RepID=A0AAN9TF31_9HEMI